MKIIVLILLFINLGLGATETTGYLSLLEGGEEIKVGEAYDYQLVLVPYSISELSKDDIEGKFFLDIFYVNEVKELIVSPHNADAVVLTFSATLAKEAQFNNILIWSRETANIPIEVKIEQVESTKLNQKEFGVLNRDFNYDSPWPWWYYALFFLLLAGIIGGVYFYFQKQKLKKKIGENKLETYLKRLEMAATHRDLEILYEERRVVLDSDSIANEAFNNLFKEYRDKQFTPDWKNQDIQHLLGLAKKAAREVKRGV